eukprot:g23806.t1
MHPSAVHGTCGCIVLRAFAASSAELAEELPQCLSLGLVDCPDLCYGPVRGWKEELPIELLWPCLPHRSHGFECWGDLWHGRSGRHGRLGGSGCTHHRPFGAWPHSLHIPKLVQKLRCESTGALHLGVSFLGAGIFCGYLVFDTWRIANVLKVDDYVEGAIQLYLDIVNIFLYVLDILMSMSKDR